MKNITKLLTGLALGALAVTQLAAQGFNAGISRAEVKEPKFLLISIASTNVPVLVGTNSTLVTRATFYGLKAVATNAVYTTNVATAYVGWVDQAGATAATNAGMPIFVDAIASGGSFTRAADGVKFNLNNIYVLGTNADKVLVKYEQ